MTAPAPVRVPAFADLVRHYRLRRGLSQAELAARAGLSARSVQRFETPWIRARPRPVTLTLLAAALRLDDVQHGALVRAAELNPRRLPVVRRCACGCACCGSA